MFRHLYKTFTVALLLVGSAILLYSCGSENEDDTAAQDETIMTGRGENLTVIMSQNGRKSYHFTTPLMEEYALAKDPYREFRKGVKIVTFKEDSLATVVDATLTANYAIYYSDRELWEAKGNVVAENSEGRTLYTQQLFWNARTRRIYSNVDSKIVQNEGRDVIYGEGFESDEQMKDWRFRRMTGRLEFEMSQIADSTATENGAQPATEIPAAEQSSAARPAPASQDKESHLYQDLSRPQTIKKN